MKSRKLALLDEAANALAKIIEKHLAKLPPKERRRRTRYAHNRLMERLAIKSERPWGTK